MSRRWIEDWNPENEEFWEEQGARIARRNLIFSILAEFLGFSVWVLWSVTAAQLNRAGFSFSTGQLYTLVAVPALVGATVRIPYTLAVARFGGRNWTIFSALLLLLPVALHSMLVSNLSTPYWALLIGAATAGFGGGNFASSMSNIANFYPDRRKGFALGVNAAGGNMGVAVSQALAPLVITWGWLAVFRGPQGSSGLFLQNAGLLWVPFILIAAGCAWFFMDNLRVGRATLRDQFAIVKRKHTWTITLIYVATFGSFVGYSAGLPLMMKTEFPSFSLSLAFLGPLVGSLARPVGGWISDRFGGARVAFVTLIGMLLVSMGLIHFLTNKAQPGAFTNFLALSVVLFAFAGLGNGAVYQMIPASFRKFHLQQCGEEGIDARNRALLLAKRETAAAVGFIGAVAAYGGWLIPQIFGLSISTTGSPHRALEAIMGLYLVCLVVLWRNYLRDDSTLVRTRLAEAEA